jgi:hypothetical protein
MARDRLMPPWLKQGLRIGTEEPQKLGRSLETRPHDSSNIVDARMIYKERKGRISFMIARTSICIDQFLSGLLTFLPEFWQCYYESKNFVLNFSDRVHLHNNTPVREGTWGWQNCKSRRTVGLCGQMKVCKWKLHLILRLEETVHEPKDASAFDGYKKLQ